MKRFLKFTFVTVFFMVQVVLLLMVAPISFFIFMNYINLENDCDNSSLKNSSVSNSRGDMVAEHFEACTGVATGTDPNYSITLQPHGTRREITMVRYDPVSNSAVNFRWIDDDRLNVDLGRVYSVWSALDKVGTIYITYTFKETQRSFAWQVSPVFGKRK